MNKEVVFWSVSLWLLLSHSPDFLSFRCIVMSVRVPVVGGRMISTCVWVGVWERNDCYSVRYDCVWVCMVQIKNCVDNITLRSKPDTCRDQSSHPGLTALTQTSGRSDWPSEGPPPAVPLRWTSFNSHCCILWKHEWFTPHKWWDNNVSLFY